MSNDTSLTLFNIRYIASIKKFNILIESYKYKEIRDLMHKMHEESKKVNVDELSVFNDVLLDIFKRRQDLLFEYENTIIREFKDFFKEAKSVKKNKYKNKDSKDKKKTIAILNASAGIAEFDGDVHAYIKHLIQFYNKHKKVSFYIIDYLKDDNIEALLDLIYELREDAENIKAKSILDVLTYVNNIFIEEKNELENWSKKYAKAYDVGKSEQKK